MLPLSEFIGNKAISADNQQATLLSIIGGESSETIRQTPRTECEIIAYLQGALHDASLNKKRRIRFAQKDKRWLESMQTMLSRIGCRSWIYREGRKRNVFVLETLCKKLRFHFDPLTLATIQERKRYLQGFFDAEGGIPRNGKRFYVQLVQKDLSKIQKIKELLSELGIKTGKIHNPSSRIDPDYWRLFVATADHRKFALKVSSLHPIKAEIFRVRMKI